MVLIGVDEHACRSLGTQGEDEAAQFLKRQGLRIVDRRYRQKWGEIDLICRDREVWVFAEVKARSTSSYAAAVDAVTPAKRLRIVRAALSYMKWKRLEGCALRFDVLLIEAGRIEWIRDAFEGPPQYTF